MWLHENWMLGPGKTGRLVVLTSFLIITLGPLSKGAQMAINSQDFSALQLAEILPRQISGWIAKAEDQVFDRDHIFDYLDGAGEVYLAFDFRYVIVREYAKEGGPAVVVEVYQMGSSEDAYGVFTHDTDGEEVVCGQEAIYAAGLLRFWKDKVFVRILAEHETRATRQLVLKIGELIARAIPGEGKRPDLLGFLPSTGLRRQTIRYFHTLVSLNSHYYLSKANLLRLSPETEAFLADYELEGGKAKSLVIRYPS